MKFIGTKELGKLCRWLRILGFDAVYFNSDNIGSLIIQALREDRIIITRRKSGLEDVQKQTVAIVSEKVYEQLEELKSKVDFKVDDKKMFTRCTLCNEELAEIKKEEIKDRIPPYVSQTQNFFMICGKCKKIYWQGSHWGNVKEVIAKLSKE